MLYGMNHVLPYLCDKVEFLNLIISALIIDMVQPCDMTQARSDSDFGVKYFTI